MRCLENFAARGRWQSEDKNLQSGVWALLDESAAQALREDVRAGRYRKACGSLLNQALGLVSLGTVAPDITPCRLPPK